VSRAHAILSLLRILIENKSFNRQPHKNKLLILIFLRTFSVFDDRHKTEHNIKEIKSKNDDG